MSTPAAKTNAADSGDVPGPNGPDEMWEEAATGTASSPQVMTTSSAASPARSPLRMGPAAETPASTMAVAHAAVDATAGSTSAAEVVASPVAASASAAGAGVVKAAGQLFRGAQKRACSVAFEVGLPAQQHIAFQHVEAGCTCLASLLAWCLLVVMSCTRHDGFDKAFAWTSRVHTSTLLMCVQTTWPCAKKARQTSPHEGGGERKVLVEKNVGQQAGVATGGAGPSEPFLPITLAMLEQSCH